MLRFTTTLLCFCVIHCCIVSQSTTIEITLWHDANGDGEQQIGSGDECGEDLLNMDEATFQLLDGGSPATDINGNPVVFMNMGGGIYRANNLAPGSNYTVAASVGSSSWIITTPHFDGTTVDIGDSDLDSDFDAGTGVSPVFEIVAGSTKFNIDLGMWKSLTLGGSVFFSYDCLECRYVGPPVQYFAFAGVDINLWGENTSGSGVFSVNLGQVKTRISGDYQFSNLPPGDYRIELDEAAFQPGGQLEIFMPLPLCDDPSNDLVNENDGEGSFNASGGIDINFARLRSGCEPDGGGTENITFDFGVCAEFDCSQTNQQYLEDQCSLVDPADPNHNSFFPICDIFILDNFCATMQQGNSPGNQPTPLCTSTGGVPHNISWFSFVAGEGDYQIKVTPGNCQNVGGAIGISNGIYTDCTFSTEVQCEGECSITPITLSSQDPPGSGNYQLEPCQVYYWFLDGCNGSVCDFEVNILGSFSQCDPDSPTDLICSGTSNLGADCLGTVCSGETILLELEGFDLGGMRYNWSVTPEDGQWTIHNSAPDFAIPTLTDNPSLDITFDPVLGPIDSATYTVCWENIRSKCLNIDGPICRTITVVAAGISKLDTITICEPDLAALSASTIDSNGIERLTDPRLAAWSCIDTLVAGLNTCVLSDTGRCPVIQQVVVEVDSLPGGRCDSTGVCDDQRDYNALRSMYLINGGPSWFTDNQNGGWPDQGFFLNNALLPAGIDMGQWQGISCTDRRVDTINLEGISVSGELTSEIRQVDHLRSLVLEETAMDGVLPSSMADLDSLRELRVGSVAMVDQRIPEVIYDLSRLQILSMWSCDLEGPIDERLLQLSELRDLDLSLNSLSGPLPEAISQLATLVSFNLNDNQLSSSLPIGVATLDSLDFLLLSNNAFEGCIPDEWMPLCTQLSFASLAGNPDLVNDVWSDYCANSVGACSVVSVDETAIDAVRIYPNPATNALYVDGLEADNIVTIYDIHGRLQPVSLQDKRLDLSSIPSGLYILRVADQDGAIHAVKRFVKQ